MFYERFWEKKEYCLFWFWSVVEVFIWVKRKFFNKRILSDFVGVGLKCGFYNCFIDYDRVIGKVIKKFLVM